MLELLDDELLLVELLLEEEELLLKEEKLLLDGPLFAPPQPWSRALHNIKSAGKRSSELYRFMNSTPGYQCFLLLIYEQPAF